MGRIDSADVFQDGKARWPSGFVLRVQPDGAWELLSEEYRKPTRTLANGAAKIDRGQWHHVELSFNGKKITARLDDTILVEVEDGSHTAGMFAIGSDWNRIQFDNVQVLPK